MMEEFLTFFNVKYKWPLQQFLHDLQNTIHVPIQHTFLFPWLLSFIALYPGAIHLAEPSTSIYHCNILQKD